MNYPQGNYLDAESASGNLSNAGLRRGAGYAGFVFACLLALLVLGSLPASRQQSTTRWQDTLNEADAALRNGETYTARNLYSQTARIASWSDDWTGVIAAACGLKTLESKRDAYFATRAVLVRAMIAAENQRSALGLNAVANAFASIGEHNAAAMARSRIPPDARDGITKSSPQSWDCG